MSVDRVESMEIGKVSLIIIFFYSILGRAKFMLQRPFLFDVVQFILILIANGHETTMPPMSLASMYRQVYVREPGKMKCYFFYVNYLFKNVG